MVGGVETDRAVDSYIICKNLFSVFADRELHRVFVFVREVEFKFAVAECRDKNNGRVVRLRLESVSACWPLSRELQGSIVAVAV